MAAAVVLGACASAALPASGSYSTGGEAAGQASANGEAPRATYTDVFTTKAPGASTGRTYAIDYFDPENPEGKPHAFSHLHLELAPGARFDTSAIPYCEASDAELIAEGASACPPESKVGTDETVVDTGFPGPGRFFTTDFVFFNNENELVLLATVRENGVRVVVRGEIGENTLDIENPMVPGTPPEGGAAKSQRGQFLPGSTLRDGIQANYLTTPPTCPKRGYWVNRIVYTWRDGVEQTVESKSPCKRPADKRPPRVRAAGIPRACTSGAFRARFSIVDASRLRAVRIRLNQRRIATTDEKRVKLRIPAGRLRAGRHTLTVTAIDSSGNRGQRRFGFRRCARSAAP